MTKPASTNSLSFSANGELIGVVLSVVSVIGLPPRVSHATTAYNLRVGGRDGQGRQMDRHLTINAVAFPQGATWVVQGIEYDIVAEASSPSKIGEAFVRAVVENVCISQELGKEPLAGIGRAPDLYQ